MRFMLAVFLICMFFVGPVVVHGGGFDYPQQQQQRIIPPPPPPPSTSDIFLSIMTRNETIIAIIGLIGTLGAAYLSRRKTKND